MNSKATISKDLVQVAPTLNHLSINTVTEIFRDNRLPSQEELIAMVDKCPYNGTAINLKAMRAVTAFGQYSHPSKELYSTGKGKMTITEWVQNIFNDMDNDLPDLIGKLARTTCLFGNAIAQPIQEIRNNEIVLKRINVLRNTDFNYAGIDGEWDRIIFTPYTGSRFPISRKHLIHVYLPCPHNPEDPYGASEAARAYPYYKARALGSTKWAEKLSRDAKGTFVLTTDVERTIAQKDANGNIIFNLDGTPQQVNAAEEAVKRIIKAEEGGAIAINKGDSLAHYASTTGMGQDYNLALMAYAEDILMAYGIPKTVLMEGAATLGQSGLNAGHRIILDVQVEAFLSSVRSQLLEKVIESLLVANFGGQFKGNSGQFITDKFLPPEMAATRVNTLMMLMNTGLLDPNDLEANNRLRIDCGLTAISLEDHEEKIRLKELAQQQANDYFSEENG